MGAPGNFAQKFQPGWLTQDITVEPWTGQFDNHGEPLFGPVQNYKCYVEEEVRMVRAADGNERASNTKVYVAGGPFDTHDRFTLPNWFRGPRVQMALAVSNVMDRTEFSHTEVYL